MVVVEIPQTLIMKLSFKYRIVGAFGGLFAVSLGVVLVFTYQWISKRAEEDIAFRLTRCIEVLKRVHKTATDERAQQFQSLTFEPRFRALAEVQDNETLQYAAAEVRKELNCAAFAFLNDSGYILAWDGFGRAELREQIHLHMANRPGNISKLFLVDDTVLEVTTVAINRGDLITGYILGVQTIDTTVLDQYSLAVGAVIQLEKAHRVLVTSRIGSIAEEELVSLTLPLENSLRFVVKLDSETVIASLRDTFRIMIYVSIFCLLIGGIISLCTAHAFSRPIHTLANMTKTIGQGDMSVRVKETGAPELKMLAHNFNWMVESLDNYQARLKEHADKLEERVEERTAWLNKEVSDHQRTMIKLRQALHKTEEAVKAKSDFLANMSHELRTPLHSILSFSEFGVEKHATAEREKLRNYFQKIGQASEILLGLVNDLLDLAKLESNKMIFKLEKTELKGLIAHVIDEFCSRISKLKLAIRFEEPNFKTEVRVDPQKMQQVIRNLLSNAIKFSPEHGNIDVTISCMNTSLRVSVRDQGVGIPENELERVFDKFVQSSITKTGAGGTGLGLSICQEIIWAHSGRIWAESSPDGGAIFLFEIPICWEATTQVEYDPRSERVLTTTSEVISNVGA